MAIKAKTFVIKSKIPESEQPKPRLTVQDMVGEEGDRPRYANTTALKTSHYHSDMTVSEA